ncbi:hypothetical protein [Euzebya sp.]|uniref:hypothetical protein n=1 Tax=Euzebya sp. TaxID=1971409 RepID=UPI0035198C4C
MARFQSQRSVPEFTHREEHRDGYTHVQLHYALPGGVELGIRYRKEWGVEAYPHQESTTFLPRFFTAAVVDPAIPYAVNVELSWDGSEVECTALSVRPRTIHHAPVASSEDEVYDDGGPISSEGLRRVPVSRVVKLAIEAATHTAEKIDGEMVHAFFATPDLLATYVAEGPRTARGVALGDDHYREVAQVYLEAVKVGVPPRRQVAAWGSCSESTASKWIRGARDRGHLPATTQGRASS